jgi:hypothetical protein
VASAAVLGSAVGGGIIGLVTMRAERAREQLARRERVDGRRRELRIAARLVMEELHDAHRKTSVARADHQWMWPLESLLATDQWNEHRRTLARELDEPTWRAVATAYQRFNALNPKVMQAGIEVVDDDDDEVSINDRIPVDVDMLDTVLHEILAAECALAEGAGVSRPDPIAED